jgi:hypothetical protein
MKETTLGKFVNTKKKEKTSSHSSIVIVVPQNENTALLPGAGAPTNTEVVEAGSHSRPIRH